MPARQYSFIFLSTTLLVTLTSQASTAITLRQPLVNLRSVVRSDLNNGGTGLTILNAADPVEDPFPFRRSVSLLPLGGTEGLLADLQMYVDEGWTFQRGRDLKGSFNVGLHYACGIRTECGRSLRRNPDGTLPRIDRDGIGAALELYYRPRTSKRNPDPISGVDNLYWIQRVITNYPAEPDLPGVRRTYIDNRDKRGNNAIYPYYGFGNLIDASGYFGDRPFRPGQNHLEQDYYWVAELYLAEADKAFPQTVTIYNGVTWGWQYEYLRRLKPDPVPVPDPVPRFELPLIPIPIPRGVPVARDLCSESDGDSECPTPQFFKFFSDSLSSGYEVDKFQLKELTPGLNFYAWINNDLPNNRCSPNTYLTAYNDSGQEINYDDNSSFKGDGFASALIGTVPTSGSLNLAVRAANGGRRGEDKGNYELYVNAYNPEDLPLPVPELSIGGSGGGGFGSESLGRTQQNPFLPNAIEGGWQVFRNVPGCRWYDPHTTYGFEFQALEDTLFTEILDFPVGDDNLFTVSVGNTILGEFGPGNSVDFVSLFGSGVSNFKITGIDALFSSTEETAFPIQLAFNRSVGSFKMRPFSQPQSAEPESVPEPSSIFGLFALGFLGVRSLLKGKPGSSQ